MDSTVTSTPHLLGSHPVLAQYTTEWQARRAVELLQRAGIASIRMDREAASLRTGIPTGFAVSILVNRRDLARAREVLATASAEASPPSGESAAHPHAVEPAETA